MYSKVLFFYITLLIFAVWLTGCTSATATLTPNPAPVESETLLPAATLTALPIEATPQPSATSTLTATPEPLALRVNGEGVALAEFQAELAQLQAADQALGKASTPEEQRQKVLDNLIDSALLAQAAFESGFQLDDAAVQAEIDRLAGQAGGAEALRSWWEQYGYTEASFRSALRRALAAAWQRDQLAAAVPETAEQVHARQIVVLDEAAAQKALAKVKESGVDFETYAFGYDLQTGGDLGWFPRGYLLQPEVEEAAFALQPGEISGVIHSQIGYHILQVVAREQRPLSPDARRYLQHRAVQEWVQARRSQSQVEVLLP